MQSNTSNGFEVYSRPIARFVDKISITKTGRVGFNKSIAAQHHIADFDGAVLYWNRSSGEMAIEFVKGPVSQAVKLLKEKGGTSLHVNAKNFFQTYDIDLIKSAGLYQYRTEDTKKYRMPRDGSVLIVKLRGTNKG